MVPRARAIENQSRKVKKIHEIYTQNSNTVNVDEYIQNWPLSVFHQFLLKQNKEKEVY